MMIVEPHPALTAHDEDVFHASRVCLPGSKSSRELPAREIRSDKSRTQVQTGNEVELARKQLFSGWTKPHHTYVAQSSDMKIDMVTKFFTILSLRGWTVSLQPPLVRATSRSHRTYTLAAIFCHFNADVRPDFLEQATHR
jgi:hypothetical protein